MTQIIVIFELDHQAIMIRTQRLILHPATVSLLTAALANPQALAEALSCSIIAPLSEFGRAPFEYALNKLRFDASEQQWWGYFPVEISANVLIGTCGYKGQPDEEGVVEIGYEVISDKRKQGFGREIAAGLIQHAWSDPRVTRVIAHTLTGSNPSSRILQSCGMQFVRELIDTEDGPICQWAMDRPVS
ncbi:MAG: GNAT family N-acetyltransferase [Saprospiraceae bacterium]|nr:GNAT family N-acetyltransferase [Saprospiraceae bacterium]HPG09210.1 GNAT family N-acetyltransferase [Saprospiraceae bacterium]HPQ98564.1 GNAT family N-acetyltransferase [Saprospiraceae bacterium]